MDGFNTGVPAREITGLSKLAVDQQGMLLIDHRCRGPSGCPLIDTTQAPDRVWRNPSMAIRGPFDFRPV